MQRRPSQQPRRNRGRPHSDRTRRHRNGVIAVLVILIASGSVTVFAGSNVLCGTATGGVGFCDLSHPSPAASRSGIPPAAPTDPAGSARFTPWRPGPSSLLDPPLLQSSLPPLGGSLAPPPIPPPHTPTAGPPLIFLPESSNDSTLSEFATAARSYLRTGDTIVLSSGADSNDTAANPNYLNSQLAFVQPQLPSGLIYEARTGGLANVALLAGGISSTFQGIVYDYEPNYEPEFNLNFTSTMANFDAFAQTCHLAGFQAIGYPYSLPLWGWHYQQYDWNYGTLLATTGVDQLEVQDQGAVHTAMGVWNRSISTLATQYGDYGIPASQISVQVSLAYGVPNQVNVSTAYAAYENAVARGVGQIELFWNLSSFPALLQLLQLIR
jgi:hypothetical protein